MVATATGDVNLCSVCDNGGNRGPMLNTGQEAVLDASHDRVVERIANTRYPFPDQTDWPADYRTLINVGTERHAVVTAGQTFYPDIVILDGHGLVAELGEVESAADLTDERVERWRALASICKVSSTGARSFFVYAPSESAARAQEMLDSAGVSYAGLRSYSVDANGMVLVAPLTTPGDAKDHR